MPGYPNYSPIVENKTVVPTENIYPDVNVSGFIEMKVSGRDYSDDINKLETIRQDNYYKKIPNDVLKGSPRLENRYDVNAKGLLDKNTEVKFSVMKEPDFPLVGHVYIRKDTSEITLGDLNSSYQSGDYVNIEKYLNGIEVKTQQSHWTGQATLGKEKSEPQLYETFGNDTRVYKVGKSFLLEGSVMVYLNNKSLKEGPDYTINYYDGTITFARTLTKVDYIKIIYEFTNPVQDFIPSLSRKNFTGITYTYNPSQNIKIKTFVIASHNETITINDTQTMATNRVQLAKTPIELGSDIVYFNSKQLTRGIDYFLKNDSGLLRFKNKSLRQNDTIKVHYNYYKTKDKKSQQFGNGTPGPYYLPHNDIIKNTLDIQLSGKPANEFIDYLYKKNTNSIEFLYPIYQNKLIEFSYTYKISKETNNPFRNEPYSFSVTHLNESTVVRDDRSISQEDVSPIQIEGPNNNIIVLPHNPIDQNKPIEVIMNGTALTKDTYTINYYEGKIILNNQSNVNINAIKLRYFHIDSIYSEHSLNGLSIAEYTQDQIQFRSLPIKYNGIQTITLYNPNEMILEEGRDYELTYLNNSAEFIDLRVKFIIGNNSILTSYPNSSDIIKFDYLYTPSINDTESNSTHEMTDVRIKRKITSDWDIYGEIANTKYSYAKSSEFKKEVFSSEQEDNRYELSKSPIEENSEMIFINGFSQTRDTDYSINYEKGEVHFINKTIPSGQNVEISYRYFLSDKPNKNNVNAYLVESVYAPSSNIIKINSKINYVDPNFIPIGNININQGASKFSNEIYWKLSTNEYASFLHENETIQNKAYSTMYSKDSYLSKFKFNSLAFETTHEIRYDDVQSSKNYKEKPKKIIQYQNNIGYSFGNDRININNSFSQKNEQQSSSNYLNSFLSGSQLNYVNNYAVNGWLKSGMFSPYIGINVDKTNAKETSTYSEKILENMGFQSSIKLNDQITNDTLFDKSIYRLSYIDDTMYRDTYYNYSNTAYVSPYPWVNTNININHEESISPIPGQEDRVEDRQGYNITQLSNDAGLEFLKSPDYLIHLFKGSTSSLGYLITKRRENNQLKNYKENRLFGHLNQFSPFDGFLIPNTTLDTYQSNLIDNKITSYQKYNQSSAKFYAIGTSFTYKPNSTYGRYFSFDGQLNQSRSIGISTLIMSSNTENITELLLFNNQKSTGITISPPNIPLLLTKIHQPIVRLERSWKTKIDENNTQSNDINNRQNFINNSDYITDQYNINYQLFNKITFENQGINEISFFNRNKQATSTGSLFRHQRSIDQSIDWSIFNLKNTEYAKFDHLNQYKSRQINQFPSEIIHTYDGFLNITEYLAQHRTEWIIAQFLSLRGQIEGQQFDQVIVSSNTTEIDDQFQQLKASSGIILKPLSGLSMSYDYGIKQLKSNQLNKKRGNQDLIDITYNPIKYENFSLQFKFAKERNWGFGFNTIEKDQLRQTSNESLSITIIPRNDDIYLGSLIMEITIPINSSDHLESVLLTGEGYLKRIVDRINPSNDLMINGLLFNLRLNL
ncbi:MAG: hypothetical protein ACO3K7_02175 [Candidatus Marinamargulisbacteria bacterium]